MFSYVEFPGALGRSEALVTRMLWVVIINTGIFLRGTKLCGKRVTMYFSEIIKLQFGKECHTLLCILKLLTNIVD